MTRREKALEKIRKNQKNVRFEEIETILYQCGFVKRQEGTSHAVFSKGKFRLTVPYRQPFVKPIYVKLLLKVLDQIEDDEIGKE